MGTQAAVTAKLLFGLHGFPLQLDTLMILDELSEIAQEWLRHSDPQNLNNEFVRTFSELALHVGDVVVNELGGGWQYARAPNFFESSVIVEIRYT
jgi:hypothetical protein